MTADSALTLSVIVPTYDAPALLARTLRSLGQQRFSPTNVEIIVVDDGSPRFEPGGWRELCHPFDLKVVRLQDNGGRASARNAGIRQAEGDIILFLDGDMTVADGFLTAHAEVHEKRERCVAIGNIRFDPNVRRDAMTRYMESRGAARLRSPDSVPFKCFVTGNSSLERRLLLEAGLFDEDFRAYGGEDLELGWRLENCGAAFCLLERAVSLHGHVRPLRQTCELMYVYGRHSLPVLLQKHPDLAGLLYVDFVVAGWSFKRLAARLALQPWVSELVEWAVLVGLRGHVAPLLFDYLWWSNRTRGFLEARRAGNGRPGSGAQNSGELTAH